MMVHYSKKYKLFCIITLPNEFCIFLFENSNNTQRNYTLAYGAVRFTWSTQKSWSSVTKPSLNAILNLTVKSSINTNKGRMKVYQLTTEPLVTPDCPLADSCGLQGVTKGSLVYSHTTLANKFKFPGLSYTNFLIFFIIGYIC